MRILSAIITIFLASWVSSAQELGNIARNSARATVSPEVKGDTVVFRFQADYATIVQLKGTWSLPDAEPMRMYKDFNGLWELSVVGLRPDLYSYYFIVDGVRTFDPNNTLVRRDGTEYENFLYLNGPRTTNYKAASQRGTVSHIWYQSRELGGSRRLTVYTPYGYEKNRTKYYPVLYLLHGEGQDEESWLSIGSAAQILDNLIHSGRAVPMIVVMPNGNADQQASDKLGLPRTDPKFVTKDSFTNSLVKEIIPFVEKNYRVLSKKSMRGIAGVDMGGHQALDACILRPELFDYMCFLGSGEKSRESLQSDLLRIKKPKFKLIWQGCGVSDAAYNDVKNLHDELETVAMDNTMYISDGGHEWRNWRLYLSNFVPILFKY